MGVGRLIGKLFGGDPASGAVLLRAYGKLPMYAEYRRLELAPGAPTAFSQWMDAGRLAWVRSQGKSETGATRPSRLLVGLPETKEAIVASVWDSRDNLGRVFPFAFFVVCQPEALGANAVERLIAASEIHRQFAQLYARLHALGSGGDFYRLYQKHAIPLRSEGLAERVAGAREGAGKIEAEPWFKSVTLDGEITSQEWFAGLLRRVERWKAQPASVAELAFSYPLARGVPFETQAVVWLEWMEGLFKKIGKNPWLVMPADNEQTAPALHLIVRDLIPDDYQLLTTDDRAYGFVEHLSAPPAVDQSTPPPSADARSGSLLAWLKEHAP